MSRPLNPFLYNRLLREFGNVKIACQGEPLRGMWVYEGGKSVFKITDFGEWYRVNCLFCRDTRHRLYINHHWGVPMPRSKDPMWGPIVCWNESQCMKDSRRRREFERRIYANISEAKRATLQILPGDPTQDTFSAAKNPGVCILVDQLSEGHQAVQYLRERGFDPKYLAENYKVMYCQEAHDGFEHCHNRLIIPIYMRGVYVGWQARYIGEADWKRVRKYMFAEHFPRRLALYDFDSAKQLPYVILTEGVSDAWRVGMGAVALFGKYMHPRQLELITLTWRAAVVLLDEDAMEESVDTYNKLRGSMPTARIDLPSGKDPGSMPYDELWELIDRNSRQQGLDLLRMLETTKLKGVSS